MHLAYVEAAPAYVGTVPLRVTRNTYAETPPETTYLLMAGDREVWRCRDAMARSVSGTLGQPCEPFAVARGIEHTFVVRSTGLDSAAREAAYPIVVEEDATALDVFLRFMERTPRRDIWLAHVRIDTSRTTVIEGLSLGST